MFELNKIIGFIKKYGTLMGFLALVVIYSAIRPDVFLSWRNIRNILEQSSILAVVSITVTMVMIAGDFDLSVGAIISMSSVICADMMSKGIGIVPSILLALLVGLAIGAINGALVTFGGIQAFVATLATMTAVGGAALYYTKGATIFEGIPDAFLKIGQGFIGPIPIAVIIMLVVMVAGWIVLEHTVFGRKLYSIGGNPKASFLAGINVKMTRLIAFLISGAGAAFAGVMLTSRLASAHPLSGSPFMLNSAAAVFLGATTFREGEANIPGTILGVFFLSVMGNGLNLLRVDSYIQQVLTGVIIILAVLLSGLTNDQGSK
jgi:ribose transport system permease protein